MIRRFTRAALALLLAFASASACALWPDSGWYWNPAEPGRGVAIEVQDDKVFLAIYTYEAGGAPIYYYSAGAMRDDRSYVGDLFRTSNGQCIGCTARPATSTLVGVVTVSFTSAETATITALGNTLALQRFDFSDTNLFSPEALYGEWAITEGDAASGVFFGERLTFNGRSTSNGSVATGARTGAPQRNANGQCTSRDVCAIGFNVSDTADEYFTFTMVGFNRAEGLVQVVAKGASPTAGAGLGFVMQRVRTGAKVRTGVGPGMTKSAELAAEGSPGAEAIQEAKAAAARKARPDPAVAAAFSTPAAAALLESVAGELARQRVPSR